MSARYQLQRRNGSTPYAQRPDRWGYALFAGSGALLYVSPYQYASEDAARRVAEREVAVLDDSIADPPPGGGTGQPRG